MRKGCVVLVVLVVLLGAGGFFVYRNGVHPRIVLWLVQQSWARTNSFEAQVDANLKVMGIGVSGSGRVRFMRPGLYDLDFNNLRVVTNTDSVWVVVPAVQTAFHVKGVNITPDQMVDKLLSGWETANPAKWADQLGQASEEVTLYAPEVVDGQRCWVLQWPAKTGERVGGRICIGQKTLAPVQFDQMDTGNQVTQTVKVHGFRRNPGLKAESFEYHPMAGYSVVEREYNPQDPLGLEALLQGTTTEMERLRGQIQEQVQKHVPGAAEWLGNVMP
jgi:outer membrane lipoprotein-sorting protein